MDTNAWRFYDTTLYIDFAEREDTRVYRKVRALLKLDGFSMDMDPWVKKHCTSLKRFHHVGNKGDLHFSSELGPRGIKLIFHEPPAVIRNNSNGGRYTMDKMANMPYLLRKRVLLARNKVVALIEPLGFKDETDYEPLDSRAQVEKRRAEHMRQHGKDAYKNISPYNNKAGDGTVLVDGEVRYFRGRTGRLKRGQVWHNINNMWWVILDRFRVYNVASYQLFTFDPAKHKRKDPRDPIGTMRAALDRAVKEKKYYRAARISDALSRVYHEEAELAGAAR